MIAAAEAVRIVLVSHPDPKGAPDLTPIEVGEVWENPVTVERATILEAPWQNPEGHATAELTALVGARVVGEHRHPAMVERFTVLEGELTVKRDGATSVLGEGGFARRKRACGEPAPVRLRLVRRGRVERSQADSREPGKAQV